MRDPKPSTAVAGGMETADTDALEAIVVTGEHDRLECTLFPRECNEVDLLTRWITASGESFVALDAMR